MAEDRFEGEAERYITQTLIRNILQNDAFPPRDVLQQKNKKSFPPRWKLYMFGGLTSSAASAVSTHQSDQWQTNAPSLHYLSLIVLLNIIKARCPRHDDLSIAEKNLTHFKYFATVLFLFCLFVFFKWKSYRINFEEKKGGQMNNKTISVMKR